MATEATTPSSSYLVTSFTSGWHFIVSGFTFVDAAASFFAIHKDRLSSPELSSLVFTPVDSLASPYSIASDSAMVRVAPCASDLARQRPSDVASAVFGLGRRSRTTGRFKASTCYSVHFDSCCWKVDMTSSPTSVCGEDSPPPPPQSVSFRRRTLSSSFFILTAMSKRYNFLAKAAPIRSQRDTCDGDKSPSPSSLLPPLTIFFSPVAPPFVLPMTSGLALTGTVGEVLSLVLYRQGQQLKPAPLSFPAWSTLILSDVQEPGTAMTTVTRPLSTEASSMITVPMHECDPSSASQAFVGGLLSLEDENTMDCFGDESDFSSSIEFSLDAVEDGSDRSMSSIEGSVASMGSEDSGETTTSSSTTATVDMTRYELEEMIHTTASLPRSAAVVCLYNALEAAVSAPLQLAPCCVVFPLDLVNHGAFVKIPHYFVEMDNLTAGNHCEGSSLVFEWPPLNDAWQQTSSSYAMLFSTITIRCVRTNAGDRGPTATGAQQHQDPCQSSQVVFQFGDISTSPPSSSPSSQGRFVSRMVQPTLFLAEQCHSMDVARLFDTFRRASLPDYDPTSVNVTLEVGLLIRKSAVLDEIQTRVAHPFYAASCADLDIYDEVPFEHAVNICAGMASSCSTRLSV